MRTGLAARPGRGWPISAARAPAQGTSKITIYVTGHRHEYLPAIDAARARLFTDHNRQMP